MNPIAKVNMNTDLIFLANSLIPNGSKGNFMTK